MPDRDLRSANPRKPSVVRKFLMWWFGWPLSPYVSVNLAIDAQAARDYVARLNAAGVQPRITLQHLFAGAIGRTLGEYPMARSRIRGHRILLDEHVGVAMPVNLFGHEEGAHRELGVVVVEGADHEPLVEIARRTRKVVDSERKGKVANPFLKGILDLAKRADGPLLSKALDGMDRAVRNPRIDAFVHKQLPVTTGLTNPGAAFGQVDGLLFRGAAVSIPTRLVHVATLWGITPIQDEAVVRDGEVVARPMLPVLLVFDHRLMDGVYAGKVVTRFAAILQDPEATFGPDGQRRG